MWKAEKRVSITEQEHAGHRAMNGNIKREKELKRVSMRMSSIKQVERSVRQKGEKKKTEQEHVEPKANFRRNQARKSPRE